MIRVLTYVIYKNSERSFWWRLVMIEFYVIDQEFKEVFHIIHSSKDLGLETNY